MNRSQAGVRRGVTRRRHRYGSLVMLVVLFTAFLVTRTQPAHAVLRDCTVADPSCPIGVDDYYTVPYNTKLTEPVGSGLLANDIGPTGTKIEFGGCTDNQSSWTDAAFNVSSDGSFTYVPAPPSDAGFYPYSGLDQLNYCIIEPGGVNAPDDTSPTVNIAVIPTVRNDSYGTRVNTPLTINAVTDPITGIASSGLAGNDSGIDPSSLSLDSTSAQGGTIDDNFDGSFVYTPPPNFHGTDTFTYTGQDWDGDFVDGPMNPFAVFPDPATVPMHGTVTIYVDGTPPTASMTAPPLVTLSTRVVPAWTGHDDVGVANYDVQSTVAPWNGPYAAWANWRLATTATTGLVSGTYGRTYCFHVRARDHAGNLSAYSASSCTSVPLRARSLLYSKFWTRVANPAFFSGEAFTTKYYGVNAHIDGVQAKRMWLVATRCPTCGSLLVRFNNVVISRVNLAGPTVTNALFPIAAFPATRAGTLRIDVTSPTGRPVNITGLAVLRA
jgi:hypothetical protein